MMKTIVKQIKVIALLSVLIFSLNMTAQDETENSGMFIRVYNMDGKKISKGNFTFINDSVLGIKRDNKLVQIQITDIGSIKTKRSAGHNVLLGSAIGGGSMAILGAASADPDSFLGWSAGEGIAAGIILGAPVGAAIGGITVLFKNPNTYVIEGDIVKLKLFADSIKNK